MVRIDRRSGRRVYGEWPSEDPKAPVIWEAFKPDSEPRRAIRHDQVATAKPGQPATAATPNRTQDSDFLQREGGIY